MSNTLTPIKLKWDSIDGSAEFFANGKFGWCNYNDLKNTELSCWRLSWCNYNDLKNTELSCWRLSWCNYNDLKNYPDFQSRYSEK